MIFFITLLIFFAAYDYLHMRIPNIVMLPSILIVGYITGNWAWIGIALLIGALLVNRGYWCGGDAKLLALTGAFITWYIPVVLLLTIALIRAYRRVIPRQGNLPVAPFMAVSTFATIGISRLIWQWCLMTAP